MSNRCARCGKIVYPIEELKCLDKVWHKGCFKCEVCGMTLSMKTYKGFSKLPYCEAHVPKAKATTVAETPEMKRLAENTKNQSNVQYHADFEKNKARFTQVADDPETMRIKQNTKNISNVTYHGDLEKKAQMEQRRTDEDGANEPAPQPAPPTQPQMEQRPQVTSQPQRAPTYPMASQPTSRPQPKTQQYHPQPQQQQPQRGYNQAPYYGGPQQSYPNHPQAPKTAYPSQNPSQNPQMKYPSQNAYHHQQTQPPHMYQDPNHNSPYSSRTSQTLIYSSQTGPVTQGTEQNVGSIADYDPMNNQYGSINQAPKQQTNAGGYRQEHNYQAQRSHGYQHDQGNPGRGHNHGQPMPQQHQPQHHKFHAPPTNLGRCFRAIYDYEAADTDEISFRDGDLIINCTSIDEGWMTGTVQRTARTGMLPANYVQRVV